MNSMQVAFDSASGMKTPWNPSRRATARVTNPLPTPTQCRFCGGSVEIVSNREIYGREYGEWPWAFMCRGCRAYVGLHPFTGIPLGTLADAETREARKRAKAAFNPLWEGGAMTRKEAYAWLDKVLGLPHGHAHIGWFDIETCDQVVLLVTAYRKLHSTNKQACKKQRGAK